MWCSFLNSHHGPYNLIVLYIPSGLFTLENQAVNDEGGEVNVAFDHNHESAQSETDTIPNVAKRLKARQQPWALVVDDNYGEGSAREHAALQPRFYGEQYCSTRYSQFLIHGLQAAT